MHNEPRRRSVKRLLLLALMLLATALAAKSQFEPKAVARPCCSDCDPWNHSDPCWLWCASDC